MTKEELLLFNELQAKRIKQDEAFDFSMEGMFRGTEDIYPETAHFVYELLQNADDCEATEARFIISKERLVFIHNGTEHFTITEDKENVKPYGHINSITAYRSTKIDKDGQIGKFGIGFKSVYQYTECPVIYDDVFKFYIKNRRIPYLIDQDHPLRRDGETLFDLEFRNPSADYAEILDRLKKLNNPVIFLPHIKQVSWQIEGISQVNTFTKEETDIGEWNDTKGNFTILNNNGNVKKLYVFRRTVHVPKEKKDVEIRVGYYIDNDGNLITNTRPNIYCFFSTEEKYQMCFIPHAPYLLTSNRAGLKKNDVNEYLHNQIAFLAGDSLLYLRDIGEKRGQLLIDENIFKILSADIAPDIMINYFLRIVKENEIILSRGKKYLRVSNAIRGDSEDIESLISREQLSLIYLYLEGEVDFVANKKDRRGDIDMELVKRIGIKVLDAEGLSNRLTTSFLEKQEDAWVDRLYNYIEKHARQYWNKPDRKNADPKSLFLRTKPIIKTTDGEWVPPYNSYTDERPNVFLPMDGGTPLRGKNYKFVDKGFYKRHESFFVGLGLHKPNIVDFIDLDILPRYRKDDVIDGDDETIKQDFVNLYNIWQKSNDEERAKVKIVLAQEYYIKATNGNYYTIDELCDDTPELHVFYDDDGAFVDYDFYLSAFDNIDYEKLRHFILELGVRTGLQILRLNGSIYRMFNLFNISNRRWPEWWEDYEIKEYDINNIDEEKSHIIWNFLCGLKRTDIERYFKARCKGYRNYSQTLEIFECESTLLLDLRKDKWVFIDGKRYCTKEITKKEFIGAGYDDNYYLNLTSHLEFKPDEIPTKTLADLGATKEQQENESIGAYCAQEGYDKEDIKRLIEKDKREKQRYIQHPLEEENATTDSEEAKETPIQTQAPQQATSSGLDSRYGSEDHGKEKEKSQAPKPKTKARSADLEDFLERQQRRIDTECEKEDALLQMAELPEYSREWFLNGLKYEYLNTEDTGREQISRSVSLSFTKVVPEHSNVYRFCNASKLIPRWLEEVDGDIRMVLRFKSGDEVIINFAMACVQDFSLRLRAKGGDEKTLSAIKWDDLTTANLDINNPKGLVKNLFEAFRQLPFGDDYNFKDNLRSNVKFIFGPPGTGKTTYITHMMSDLMRKSSQCRILVLAPTNQACDVITRQLMEQNPDTYQDWLGRFVATNDEVVDQYGLVCDRDSTLYKNNLCCVVSTMARLSYDFFENVNDGKKCLKDIKWDYVICDEGSMLSLPEIVYTIYNFSYDEKVSYMPTPIVIAGDPKQLQPIDSCNVWDKRNIYSMVELDSFQHPKTVPIQFNITNLETQYRSVPAIGELFSRYAYDGMLKHGRKETDRLDLHIPGLSLKPITYMPFLVDNYDDIYGAKRMAGSNVHIYSAIMTAELCKYISREYNKSNPIKGIKIGIICPYIAQVQLVEKMLDSSSDITFNDKVEITAGTIHSFQGDECNIIFALFNPPKGMASKRQDAFTMLLNDDHLVNVAISRARDYLCIMVPTHDSYGRENLRDINRVADILLSKEYSRSKDVGQVDCSKLERLLFGQKGYLKSKSYITSHQMANVYTPTGYMYDIRVDESAIDIQIGTEKQSQITPQNDGAVTKEAANTISTTTQRDDLLLQDIEKTKTILTNENVSEQIVELVIAKDEPSLSRILEGCSGHDIPLYRHAIKELVERKCLTGEDFWWFSKLVLKVNPTIFRKPIIDALYSINTIECLVTPTINKEITEVVALLFKDSDKVSQDIDFLYVFRNYYEAEMPQVVKKYSREIAQPDVFVKLFEIFHIEGENKIDFLVGIKNEAALFVVCQLFADKNQRGKMSQKDYNVYRYAEYRKSICDRLSGDSALEKLASRIIRSTIQTVSGSEQEYVDSIFAGGFYEFKGIISKIQAKQKRADAIKNMDANIGKNFTVIVSYESVNHFLVNIREYGVLGLMPKRFAGKADLHQGEIIEVKIIGFDKQRELYFVAQKECTMKDVYAIPLANIGDSVVLEYFNEGKSCYVRTGCLKQIRPIVIGQKEHFDYKAKYPATIIGRRSFFDYEMKLVGNVEPKPKKYRLNKIAKTFNIGIPTIVSFFKQKGYIVASNPNTRITEEMYKLIDNEYGERCNC